MRASAGEVELQASLSTDFEADPFDILGWFVRRWSIDVSFAEVRRHLGVETPRPSSDPAMDRTTSVLVGLFSLVTLWVNDHYAKHEPTVRVAS